MRPGPEGILVAYVLLSVILDVLTTVYLFVNGDRSCGLQGILMSLSGGVK